MSSANTPPFFIFDSLDSTNIKAAELLSENAQLILPCLVAAKMQTQGRGQKGTTWYSPPDKNIYVSLILETSWIPVEDQFLLSKIIALGTRNFLKRYINADRIYVKWPNDLYIDDSKIVGILIENKIIGSTYSHAIAGIGINFFQEQFPPNLSNPTSVYIESENSTALSSLEVGYLHLFEDILAVYDAAKKNTQIIHNQYLEYLLYFEEERKYSYKEQIISAKITGVDAYGHLKLRKKEGENIVADLKELTYLLGKDHIQ